MIKCSNNLVQWQQIVIGYLHITNSVRCNHANGRERKTERESEEERDKKSARHEMKSFLARLSSQSSLVLVFARECRRNRVRYIRINIDDMFHHSHSHI